MNRHIHFVFVWPHMDEVGGIQTLIIESCNAANKAGASTSIVCDAGEFSRYAPINTRVLNLRRKYCLNESICHLRQTSAQEFIFISFNATSCALASILRFKLRNTVTASAVLLGVYHPRALIPEGGIVQTLVARNIVRSLGWKSTYFMNNECRDSHATGIDDSLSRSRVIYLPVQAQKRQAQQNRSGVLRVCSVGRITAFKAYNFHAVDICREISSNGISIEWDIYGWGEEEGQLQQQILQSEHVRFHGALPLHEFESTVSRYDVFVGMGMSAVKASLHGIPTILATDNGADRCIGFSFEARDGNLGEMPASGELVKISTVLLEYVAAPQEIQRTIAEKCVTWGERFDYGDFFSKITELFSCAAIAHPLQLLAWSKFQIASLKTKNFLRNMF